MWERPPPFHPGAPPPPAPQLTWRELKADKMYDILLKNYSNYLNNFKKHLLTLTLQNYFAKLSDTIM